MNQSPVLQSTGFFFWWENMFVDKARITLKAGRGGDGAVSL